MNKNAYLLLDDGLLFEGIAIGKIGTTGGEICFNTGMTGYQEIYTDPSYYGQIVVNTTAHIGNYGVCTAEQESDSPKIKGLVINSFSDIYSRKIAQWSLQQYLENHQVVGISGIDTRKLVRHIRKYGAMNAVISSTLSGDQLQKELKKIPNMDGLELSSKVCTNDSYTVGDSSAKIKIAVLDLGVKNSIITHLVSRGCFVKIFPSKAEFSTMEEFEPDGYLISNGPGDPTAMDYAINTLKNILNSNKPLFGICLGNQLLALACGLSTYKMKYGHRGLNHPVKNLSTGLGEITTQNHGFAISRDSIGNNPDIEVTHVHLNDETIMGIRLKSKRAFAVQYHPEATSGPHDSTYIFDQFINSVIEYQTETRLLITNSIHN